MADDSAITFHVLTLTDHGRGAELYIKMNSRGKPLTEFEVFKGRFQSAVRWAGQERGRELALKLDGTWSDLMWKINADELVDDDFVKLFGFLTEVCEWRSAQPTDSPATTGLAARAEHVFGEQDPLPQDQLALLVHAFDTWLDGDDPIDVAAEFAALFVSSSDLVTAAPTDGRLRLFTRSETNLLEACCHTYGVMPGNRRTFTLADSLLLYAVLLHRQVPVEGFARRLRMLRNLTEASVNELRPDRGPELVADVHALLSDGGPNLGAIKGHNARQAVDEQRKLAFLSARPELETVVFALEDHDLLRGRLATFALDSESASLLESRADAFERALAKALWPLLTAALLTKGTYGRQMGHGYYYRFGSPSLASWWRELFTEASDADAAINQEVLAALLDDLHGCADVALRLEEVRRDWLTETKAAGRLDWRYYLVKYDTMRSGDTGCYYARSGRLGYELGMLSTKTIQGYYLDPFIEAMVETGQLADQVKHRQQRYGAEQWVPVGVHGTQVRVVERGLEIRPSEEGGDVDTLRAGMAGQGHNVVVEGDRVVLLLDQVDGEDGHPVDTEDRVEEGAQWLRDLMEADL